MSKRRRKVIKSSYIILLDYHLSYRLFGELYLDENLSEVERFFIGVQLDILAEAEAI